jgi:hypothetical protein
MDLHERIQNLYEEIKTMGIDISQLDLCWQSAELVRVNGVTSETFLPSGTIDKNIFIEQRDSYMAQVQKVNLSIESGITQREQLRGMNKDVGALDNQLRAFAQTLGALKFNVYKLHQRMPIDAKAFYDLLSPKLYELNELMAARSELRLKN